MIKSWEIFFCFCAVVAFLVTLSSITRENKVVAIYGAIAMAVITGAVLYIGWFYG